MKTITDTILDHLANCPNGRESISHMQDVLRGPMPGSRRCYGPTFPSNHSLAMDEFKRLGFSVVSGKRRFTWEITL